jgi:hypothetical protein
MDLKSAESASPNSPPARNGRGPKATVEDHIRGMQQRVEIPRFSIATLKSSSSTSPPRSCGPRKSMN